MLLPSIKYDLTILRRVIMTLILLKTIHTSHHKNYHEGISHKLYYYIIIVGGGGGWVPPPRGPPWATS